MKHNDKVEAVKELAAEIRKAGFRVFLAESGTYGCYTDAAGSRVVSFQLDFGGFKFTGNYRPVNSQEGRQTGAGWVMGETWNVDPIGLQTMLESGAPQWATGGRLVQLVDLAQHLKRYQSTSRYAEFGLSVGDRVTTAHGSGVVEGWEAFDNEGMQAENSLNYNGNRVAIKLDEGHSWTFDSLYYEREGSVKKEAQ